MYPRMAETKNGKIVVQSCLRKEGVTEKQSFRHAINTRLKVAKHENKLEFIPEDMSKRKEFIEMLSKTPYLWEYGYEDGVSSIIVCK